MKKCTYGYCPITLYTVPDATHICHICHANLCFDCFRIHATHYPLHNVEKIREDVMAEEENG